jgi:hypothetical protein
MLRALKILSVLGVGIVLGLVATWATVGWIDAGSQSQWMRRRSFGFLWVRALMADEGLTFHRVINVASRTNGTELGSRVGALKAKRCS